MDSRDHIPVLLQETIENLDIKPGKKYIDATIGIGGHAREIIKRGGRVLGIDRDKESLERLRHKCQRLKVKCQKLTLVHGNFADIDKIAKKYNFTNVAGILFDLGLSSWQIDKSGRGFSYLKNEPLDMRINKDVQVTAADILNSATREELYEIFTKYAQEQHSWRIAESVSSAGLLKTTFDLKRAIIDVIGRDGEYISTVARIFQAIRIAVNSELELLEKALNRALGLLEREGKLLVISFHSLEDRIVKLFYREQEAEGMGVIITKRPITPKKRELEGNRRARSAKLRIFQKK